MTDFIQLKVAGQKIKKKAQTIKLKFGIEPYWKPRKP